MKRIGQREITVVKGLRVVKKMQEISSLMWVREITTVRGDELVYSDYEMRRLLRNLI